MSFDANTQAFAIVPTLMPSSSSSSSIIAPPKLYLHTMNMINNTLLVFGGYNMSSSTLTTNTLYAFSLTASSWHLVTLLDNSPPPPRAGHAAVVAYKKLYVLAGCQNASLVFGAFADLDLCSQELFDVWVFEPATPGTSMHSIV